MSEAQPQEPTFERKYGTRSEVWEGTAMQTRGKLKKDDLVLSRSGRIVSKRKSELAKKSYAEHGFRKREISPPPSPEKKRRRKRRKNKKE